MAEAHAAGIKSVVCVLIRAHVEIGAALAGKIINVLLQKGFRKGYRLGIGHVDGGLGVVIRQPARTGQFLRRGEDRVHVSGGIHQRNDGNASRTGVSNDVVHLGFGQFTAACSRVLFISGLDSGLHYFMAKAARNAAHYFFFTSSQSQCSCENSFLSGGFCLCWGRIFLCLRGFCLCYRRFLLRCGRDFLRHRGVYLLYRGLRLRLGSLGLLRRHDLGIKRRQNVVRQHFFFDGRFDTVFQ